MSAGQRVLDEFFGPRPLNEGLVRESLRGALDVMVRPEEGRVSVLKRGQREDTQLTAGAAAEVIRAYEDNPNAPTTAPGQE